MWRTSPLALACYDWLLAWTPVAAYLFVEVIFVPAGRSHNPLDSPEWGIATVFLCFMTIIVLAFDLPSLPRDRFEYRPNTARLFTVLMAMFMMGGLSISGRLLSLEGDQGSESEQWHAGFVVAQWILFGLASAIFVWLKCLYERCRET